jgi:hypothetical protein
MVIRTQERAWGGLHHIITVSIELQVGFNEHPLLHLQHLADAFDVGCFETGRIIPAAIGTGETIDFGECFFVKVRQPGQHLVPFGFLQKTGVGLGVFSRFFLPLLEYILRHIAMIE